MNADDVDLGQPSGHAWQHDAVTRQHNVRYDDGDVYTWALFLAAVWSARVCTRVGCTCIVRKLLSTVQKNYLGI